MKKLSVLMLVLLCAAPMWAEGKQQSTQDASLENYTVAIFPTVAADQTRSQLPVTANLVDDPWGDDPFGAGTLDFCSDVNTTKYADRRCARDAVGMYQCVPATGRTCRMKNEYTVSQKCKTCDQ